MEPIQQNARYHTECMVKITQEGIDFEMYCEDHERQVCQYCLRDLPCVNHPIYYES